MKIKNLETSSNTAKVGQEWQTPFGHSEFISESLDLETSSEWHKRKILKQVQNDMKIKIKFRIVIS